MKILGEAFFAKDSEGRLLSRIGTMFFRTPGIVTKRGVHAMQRLMWIEEVNRIRAEQGERALTPTEEDAEMMESTDLIFTDEFVLIRPDPERMDLALRADAELQKMVSKRKIRFLNTSSQKVRAALTARGENWRMARRPISQEDMTNLIENSRVPIGENPIYYYNHTTGTRYLTASTYSEVEKMDDEAYRRQIVEIVTGLSKRNRLGHPEVDIFPPTTPVEIRNSFRTLDIASLSTTELRRAVDHIETEWRMSLPPDMRDETVVNYAWRNEMCRVLTREPNETVADELIAGISPEFYRQIEWLPGARIESGEVVFDEVYDEAARTQDPELLALCDNHVRSFLFNTTRLLGDIEYMNVGRITRSLSRDPVQGSRRGHVYVMQYKDHGSPKPRIAMIRLQKWGIGEHLNEGKDLLSAIMENDSYTDYILDRRLMCRQLGMDLPRGIAVGHFTEKYHGNTPYNGISIRETYFARHYIPGTATDKIPLVKYRNPAWALKFAFLLGKAAATDLIVGRRSTTTDEFLFDQHYEVLTEDADGIPEKILIMDHAGSFVNYEGALEDSVAAYAEPMNRRRKYVPEAEYAKFARSYVEGFRRSFEETQAGYRARRRAYDELFSDRPYDENGSGAYRWACVLKRLDAADPKVLADILQAACGIAERATSFTGKTTGI